MHDSNIFKLRASNLTNNSNKLENWNILKEKIFIKKKII